MLRRLIAGVLLIVAAAGIPGPVAAATLPLQLVASGFSKPVFVTNAGPTDPRLFVVEQTGKIKIVGVGTFLDLTSIIVVGPEQGVLGLAFHPDYATNGLFYVDYSRKLDGDTIIAEYHVSTVNPNVADPASARIVLKINQPTIGHNGGWLGFYGENLYFSHGDGSLRRSPAQNVKKLLGKIGRINPLDPDGAGPLTYSIPADNPYVGIDGRDEIWARGLRNPWRCSFDHATGALWCGDAGESLHEEIDRSTVANANYGWNKLEGFHYYKWTGHTANALCTGSCYDLPILEYSHGRNCVVAGGYVSRRPGAAMEGKYIFGDFCSGNVWIIPADFVGGTPTPPPVAKTSYRISSFGEDNLGRLYLIDYAHGGAIYRLTDS